MVRSARMRFPGLQWVSQAKKNSFMCACGDLQEGFGGGGGGVTITMWKILTNRKQPFKSNLSEVYGGKLEGP